LRFDTELKMSALGVPGRSCVDDVVSEGSYDWRQALNT
jgi:hypothetical protein